MPRAATGTTYKSRGTWFASISAPERCHFRLTTCRTVEEARERTRFLAALAVRLRNARKADFVETVCRAAADAEGEKLRNIERLVDGIVGGTERASAPQQSQGTTPNMTLREFAEQWTSNALAERFRQRVRRIDHRANASRLATHVYGVAWKGRKVGDLLLSEISIDVAEHVLAQATLPEASVRHVAQLLHRILSLAVFPARLLERSPLPRGWLPRRPDPKERSFLFPHEEAAFLRCTQIPLVRRMLVGFCCREGVRKENVARLEWSALTLDLPDGGGYVTVDHTKNGRGIAWSLDPGTAEALRRWRKIAPPSRYVFPAVATPRHRRSRKDRPLYVDHLANQLRDGLRLAGVVREKLFERSVDRMPLRAHDLRATFVTLALAAGKSEDFVRSRTGHSSSVMIARYRRQATTIEELNLGWLFPMHTAIPELSEGNDAGLTDARTDTMDRGAIRSTSRVRNVRDARRLP
jgi:integrase